MRIDNEFTVASPIDAVWTAFQDVPSVSACLPGAQLTDDLGGGRFAGRMSVRLGPIGLGLEGEATVVPEPEQHAATITGQGIDKRGGSRGQVSVHYVLAEVGPTTTKVSIASDITLAGPAAQFGRTGLLQEVSKRLIGDFARCLEAKLAAATPEEAAAIVSGEVGATSLLASSLGATIKRSIRRG
ncbi:MAG: SRPBCC family protein [Chloroflexi bacterium]|nr:SRPBCC family protein [Chloroflexota bacterium]